MVWILPFFDFTVPIVMDTVDVEDADVHLFSTRPPVSGVTPNHGGMLLAEVLVWPYEYFVVVWVWSFIIWSPR